jgi:hypothetical protein
MTEPAVSVTYRLDDQGNDCYWICLPEHDVCSIVSSAHLIEERTTQLLRRFSACPPSSGSA